MALTEKQIEERRQKILGDPDFVRKMQARLANAMPEHIHGSYQHRQLVDLSVECREQVKLREDFEALASVAWDLLNKLVDVSNTGSLVTINKNLNPEQISAYEILSDYFENEEEDE